jgi:hypothetical protein
MGKVAGARCRGRWGRRPERSERQQRSSGAAERESEMQRESETKSNGEEAERWPVEIFG